MDDDELNEMLHENDDADTEGGWFGWLFFFLFIIGLVIVIAGENLK